MLNSKIEVVISTIVTGLKNNKFVGKASQFDLFLISNNFDIDGKFCEKTIIKANKRTFNLIAVANNYIETFSFEQNCFLV